MLVSYLYRVGIVEELYRYNEAPCWYHVRVTVALCRESEASCLFYGSISLVLCEYRAATILVSCLNRAVIVLVCSVYTMQCRHYAV